MADNQAAEKTEQPTPKKLQKAISKGLVPQSQEFTSAITLLVLVAAIALVGPGMLEWFITQIKTTLEAINIDAFSNNKSFIHFINGKITDSLLLICPILAALFVGSAFANIAISGLNYTPEAISIKFDQMNPVAGFGKLINQKSIVKLILSILKLLVVSLVVWFYLHGKLGALAQLRWAWSAQLLTAIAKLIFGLMIRVGILLFILGVADAYYQKWKYLKDLRMTRQEVKQERRDWEGSPEVKTRIRMIQVQMALRRISAEVPKATVVLVNPTHVAVAIRYDSKTMEAPILVAKGAGYLAEKIREIARAYGVPIITKPELARTIYSTVKAGNPIPESLYVAVAEILAMIYRLRRRK